MKKLNFVAAAVLALASVAANAATPITLQNQGGGFWSGVFEGSASSNLFSLDLSTFASVIAVEGAVSANVTFGSGYNITSVLFNGLPLYTADINTAKKDAWSLDLGSVAPTMHTIRVDGISMSGGKFTGSIGAQVTAVPEPSTYALLLAGLGAVGFVARRRKAA